MQITDAELAERKRKVKERNRASHLRLSANPEFLQKARDRIKKWREITGNRERGRKKHIEWMGKPGNSERKRKFDLEFKKQPEARARKNAGMRKARSTPAAKAKRRIEHLIRYSNEEIRQKQLAKKRQWNKKPGSKAIQSRQKHLRRARERNATIGDCDVILKWEKSYRSNFAIRCYWCRDIFNGMDCHTDHIIPLSKHGPHEIGNLCVACSDCNLRKHAKTLEDWNSSLVEPVLF
jgi:5-methylcytosine-specific restriction endonuclease McrA